MGFLRPVFYLLIKILICIKDVANVASENFAELLDEALIYNEANEGAEDVEQGERSATKV